MDKQPITLTPEQMEMAKNLSNLQRMTILNRHMGMAPVDAYFAAGGKAKTVATAAASVSRMLKDVKVVAFNDSIIAAATTSAIMTREEALGILTNQARTNVSDIANFRRVKVGDDEEGEPAYQTVWDLKNSEDIKPEQMASIIEVSTGRDGLKFKMHDQKAAIKQLSDMEGWNAAQRVEHTGKDGEAIKTEDVDGNAMLRRVAFLLAKGATK
jgi:phage terminase small subunit